MDKKSYLINFKFKTVDELDDIVDTTVLSIMLMVIAINVGYCGEKIEGKLK